MEEVLWTNIQFLIWQISENSLSFLGVILGVPAFWLVMKLTNILYEEKALNLAAVVFAFCSIVSTIMFFTKDSSEYYVPMLLMLVGILTFFCVSPFFCEKPVVSFNQRRKTLTIDSVTIHAGDITQVSVKRCFNRSRRSCWMELFVTEEGKRCRSIYYETNDVAEFRTVIAFLKNLVPMDYDCAFTQSTLEIPFFSSIVKTVCLSLLVFCLLIPATLKLNEKRATMSLPEYKMQIVPKKMYEVEALHASTDVIAPIFSIKAPQIIVFDASQSSQFLNNYRKALLQFPNQNFDYNIISIRKKGMIFKHAFGPKQTLPNLPEDVYTKYIASNCGKLCFLDNELKVLYSTSIETVDPRANNIQDAVNMLNFVQTKRLEQMRNIKEAEEKAKALEEDEQI